MGAAAGRNFRGVAADEDDVLRMHAEQIGHHLGEARLVALAGRLRADRKLDLAGAEHGDLDALVRNADRRFQIVRDADAAELAALLRLAPARGKALPVGHLDHALHVAGEVAAVVEQPAGGAIGQLLLRDDVLLADAQPVDAELVGGEIDQPLQHQGRLGPAGAAERRGRHGVGHHRAAAHVHQRDVVDRGGDAIGVAQRHIGHGLAAAGAEVIDVIGGDAAVAGQRQPRGGDEIAAGIIGEEGFRAVVGPFHRPADALRRPQDRGLLGIEIVAQPKAAADVGADEADLLQRQPEAFRQHHARRVDALVAGNQRVGIRRRVVGRDAGARLHLAVGDALVDEGLLDDEIGRVERRRAPHAASPNS